MKAPETVVLSQSALESTMDAIEAHLRAKDPERFNALPWREQAEKDPEGFAEMSEIIRIAVSVTRPPPLQSGEIGELVEKAKVLRLIGDAHRTQDYAGRTHGFIYNAGETVPLGAVVIAAEGCEQEVGRARLDLIVAAVNALPTLLATITALQAELASARKVVEGLNAHVEAMQGKVVEYLVPEAYAALNGMMASAKDDTTMRDKLFVSDMIYMLDGPEQRDVQTPARDWLAGATP